MWSIMYRLRDYKYLQILKKWRYIDMDNKKEIFEKYESSVRSYCRAFPSVFCKAKGSIITDLDGKEYIDFFCGAGSVNYGHNNDYIKSKMMAFLENDGFMHALDMMTEAKADFIEYFEKNVLEPRNMNYKILFPNPTGTNAVGQLLSLQENIQEELISGVLWDAFTV